MAHFSIGFGPISDILPTNMQTKFLSVLFAATLIAGGARAQDSANNAPAVATPTPMQQQAAPAPQANVQAAPTPNQIIYAPQLPSPTELTNVAAAQGASVQQIVQSANQVTVIYRYANGQINTVAYQLLPTTNVVSAPAPTTVIVPSPAPTVIYEQAPRVVYYETYAPYYPRYYYPPVSLNLGFGYYRGWGGSYWHGGGHYGHRW
jgi:hypothetical protein